MNERNTSPIGFFQKYLTVSDIVYLYHDRPGTVCAALYPHRRVSIIHSHRFQNAKAFPLHNP